MLFVPKALLSLLNVNKETVDTLRTEVAVLRSKNEVLERELTAVKINSDWFRHQINQLNAERVQLMAKAYPGLQLPTPEFARLPNKVREAFDLQTLFEDLGDEPTVPTA